MTAAHCNRLQPDCSPVSVATADPLQPPSHIPAHCCNCTPPIGVQCSVQLQWQSQWPLFITERTD